MNKLFDSLSYLDIEPEDYVEEYLCHTGTEEADYENHKDLLKKIVDDFNYIEWESFLEQCRNEENRACLMTGYAMFGDRTCEVKRLYMNLTDAVRKSRLGYLHTIFSINDAGVFVSDQTNHDVPCDSRHYEYLILTDAGEKFYKKHQGMKLEKIYEALKLHGRSRNVNIKIFDL